MLPRFPLARTLSLTLSLTLTLTLSLTLTLTLTPTFFPPRRLQPEYARKNFRVQKYLMQLFFYYFQYDYLKNLG